MQHQPHYEGARARQVAARHERLRGECELGRQLAQLLWLNKDWGGEAGRPVSLLREE